MTIPWFSANIPGPKQAKVVTPSMAAKIMGKAKRKMMICGSKIDGNIQKHIVDLSKEMSVVVAPSTLKNFSGAGFELVAKGVVEVTNLLRDETWKGFDGKGNYDLVAYLGFPYYLESQMLSVLKHFAKVKTLSIGRFYQPNADYSFDNLREDEWEKGLEDLVSLLVGRK
ncbi:MAG: CO dehydrogenase/acetyl-CoA synthase complex subunit epsilon [Methanocellales archaeon]|nr:CO dehydrogenase/acetyl-CoA synthase complex subunit epsilon [Methanocellales archaeon]